MQTEADGAVIICQSQISLWGVAVVDEVIDGRQFRRDWR